MTNGDFGMWLFLAFMVILLLPIYLSETTTWLNWSKVDEDPTSAICKTEGDEVIIDED